MAMNKKATVTVAFFMHINGHIKTNGMGLRSRLQG